MLVFSSSIGMAPNRGERPTIIPARRRQGRDSTGADWTPHELRHSFVSVLSDIAVSIEDIAEFCGHSGATVDKCTILAK